MKSARRKLTLCVIALLLLLTSSGCGFKDIDKRFFVVSLGVDKPDPDSGKKYKVTVKLAIPSPLEKFGSNRSLLVAENSDSITGAIRIIKSKVDKELDFGHMKVILFGDKLIQGTESIRELMDWFTRRRDIQEVAWIAIAKPDAYSVLGLHPKTERLPSNMMFLAFGRVGTETPYITSEYSFDFNRRMTERGLDPIMPIIEERGDQQIAINKMALFDKERIRLRLDPEETKIFNSFYQPIDKFHLRVNTDELSFSISGDKIKTDYKVDRSDPSRTTLRAKIVLSGTLEESEKPVPSAQIPELEKAAEETIRERTTALFEKFQKQGLDPIGFGLRYRSTRPISDGEWKNWLAEYPDAKVAIDARVRITGTGVIE